MRLQRMLSIVLIIEAKGKVKARDLADKFETSVRTIYRDIESICEAGIPLVTETGPNGGIRFMEGYKLDIKNLQIDEIINLYLAATGINAGEESNMNINVNTALLKIQNNLSPKFNEELNRFTNKFLVDQNPWWGEKIVFRFIDILMQSLWENKKLMITYKKINGYTSSRIIRPYGIVVKQIEWYLIAYCEFSKDIRTFKCDRIIECELLDELFEIQNDFNLEIFWHTNNDKFIKECNEREQYLVKVRLNKKYIDKLKNFQIQSIENDENYIQAVVNMYSYELAKEIVVETIGYLQVLEPYNLQGFAVDELERIIKKYSNNDL